MNAEPGRPGGRARQSARQAASPTVVPRRSGAHVEQSLEFHRRTGFKKGEGQALSFLASFERESGNPERALELLDCGVELSRESGFTWQEELSLSSRAETLFELGRPSDAGHSAAKALEIAHRIGDLNVTIGALTLLARAESEQGHDERAGRLWGAIEAEMERTPLSWFEREREELEASIIPRSSRLFEEACAAGRNLGLDEVVEYALAKNDG